MIQFPDMYAVYGFIERAFHYPLTSSLKSKIDQTWNAYHLQFDEPYTAKKIGPFRDFVITVSIDVILPDAIEHTNLTTSE